ncbi:hypothetical protein NE237_030892 [Protea cynaroides]|uniref:Phytocyanin domain-containing protein n=1 Tax=Protea cynaroides TaxID=273540 RepID=A0A9Q0GV27_9MAGN|nr:hypothetical protein NE237_030892 [Protea cynaroides]
MSNFRFFRSQQFLCAVQFLMLLQTNVFGYQYTVGGLHAWGNPTTQNPDIYAYWSEYTPLVKGDSLFFLYPPTQDSVIQVTEDDFNACNLKNPILSMDDGNSLFSFSSAGRYYFTSGIPGRCENLQKLQISVLFANGSALPPNYEPPNTPPANSPSYPTVFGNIPTAPNMSPEIAPSRSYSSSPIASSSLPLQNISSTILAALFGASIFVIITHQ